MAVRKWHLARAVDSFSSLCEVLDELTLEEVLTALDLESRSNRRRSLIDRLISRAVRLNEVKYKADLVKKYGAAQSNANQE